jgi:predicted kinase
MSEREKKERPRQQYRKSLVVFAGLPLTGKTTMAKNLAMLSNYTLIDVDDIRHQEMPVVQVLEREKEKLAVERTYVRMFDLAKKLLNSGKPVIIAGVFSRSDPYHNQLKTFVDEEKVPLKFFYLDIPAIDELERRIQIRLSSPDNLSNVTSHSRFSEVQARYKLIEGIEIIRIPSELSMRQKNALVRKNLADLRKS